MVDIMGSYEELASRCADKQAELQAIGGRLTALADELLMAGSRDRPALLQQRAKLADERTVLEQEVVKLKAAAVAARIESYIQAVTDAEAELAKVEAEVEAHRKAMDKLADERQRFLARGSRGKPHLHAALGEADAEQVRLDRKWASGVEKTTALVLAKTAAQQALGRARAALERAR